MSVLQDYSFTILVVVMLFLIGCILSMLEGKPRA